MSSLSALHRLRARLMEKMAESTDYIYQMPARWFAPSNAADIVYVHPYHVWLHTIEWILAQPPTEPVTPPKETKAGSWSRYAVIYNLFIRSATAFDHDGDGQLGRPNLNGFSEIGSFMKSILLLRYIKALGCNTVHLLPITAVGRDGSKGDMGSPYAIRNPYKLDENLAEPSLGLGAEAEFAAFVEAAHHLGLRIVMEFVFRTSSKDGDWVKEHPEWFYWIDAHVPDRQPGSNDPNHYGMPIFSETEAELIEIAVEEESFDRLLAPNLAHRQMFLPPPQPEELHWEGEKWIARYADGKVGRIPGAFADWPVDDPQPPWGDVTYLRMYDHPDYNYIAYNTIRMYSSQFAQPELAVRPLWERIIGIIPFYQEKYGIDGAMIDMGHALPPLLKQELIETARQRDAQFAFWDENFKATEQGMSEGYNAVIGSLPFVLPKPVELEEYLIELAYNGTALPIFGAVESHNTPRAITKTGGERYVKYGISLAMFVPALPFIHNGSEFGEPLPVNTGLDFTPAEIATLPSHTLPLFSAVAFRWIGDTSQLTQWWQTNIALRQRYAQLLSDTHKETMAYLHSHNPAIRGIVRHTSDWSLKIALVFNRDMENIQNATVWLPTGREKLMDHYAGTFYEVRQSRINITLAPAQAIWLEL